MLITPWGKFSPLSALIANDFYVFMCELSTGSIHHLANGG